MQSTGNNFPFHPKFQNLLINPIKTKKKFSKTKFNKPNKFLKTWIWKSFQKNLKLRLNNQKIL